MGQFKDLTGQKFNKLTVIKKYRKDKHGNILWECKCDCGSKKIMIVRSKDLKIGSVKSCGCLRIETVNKVRNNDKKCIVDGCNDKHLSLGYCNKHYKEYKKYGHIRSEEEKDIQKQELSKTLSEKLRQNKECEYCNKEGYYNKEFNAILCGKHYTQLRKNGEILKRTRHDINEYVILDEYAEIVLYDGFGNEKERAIIDLEDVERCKQYRWHSDSNGYAETMINKKRVKLHNYLMNPPKSMIVDHKDRNRRNNRKRNLRICTKGENNANTSVRKSSKTGVRGVEKLYNKYYAYINKDGKKIHLGGFKNIEDAIKIRQEAELEYFGEFAPHLYDKKGENANEA